MKFLEYVEEYKKRVGYDVDANVLADRIRKDFGGTPLVREQNGVITDIDDVIVARYYTPQLVSLSTYSNHVGRSVRTIRYYYDIDGVFKSKTVAIPTGSSNKKPICVLDLAEVYYQQSSSHIETAVISWCHRKYNQDVIAKMSQYALEHGINIEAVVTKVIKEGIKHI